MITENNSVISQGCVQKTLTDEQMQMLKNKGLEVSGNLDLADVLGMLPRHITRVIEYPLQIGVSDDAEEWYIYYGDAESPYYSGDNLLLVAYDMLLWCIDSGHIPTIPTKKKAFPNLTRLYIINKLTGWFQNGILTTTQIVGEQPRVIESLCNKRELSYTPINRLLFIGDSKESEVFKELKSLIDGRRILAPLTAKVETDTRTDYELLQSSKRGELYRFVYGGLILYID